MSTFIDGSSVQTGALDLTTPLAIADGGTGAIDIPPYKMVLANMQTATGTAINFTGIPSWAKRITVSFTDLSTNGASPVIIRLGSGSIATTGYASNGNSCSNVGSFIVTSSAGAGIYLEANSGISASTIRYGVVTLTLIGNNIWMSTSQLAQQSIWSSGQGGLAVPGVLDRLQLTTINGTDTFDSGLVNLIYEGY